VMRKNLRAYPVYRELLETGKLRDRVDAAKQALLDCHLCGNQCSIDRTREKGPCRIDGIVYVASYGPHFGEEDVLRGWRGSGAIFFSGCNLHCAYCQNSDISQTTRGTPVSAEQLAAIILELQSYGCHNINLVSPTHVVPLIIPGLALAIQAGLSIPLVYNTGGYDATQALELMRGLVDIYMPDMKYHDAEIGYRLSLVRDYPSINQAATKEMHRQVGDLQIDESGLAVRGLLIRHLVLPGSLAGTAGVARFLAEEISPATYVNLMGQYRPAYRAREAAAREDVPLDRSITQTEYQEAVRLAREAGLYRFDHRRIT